MTGDAPSRRCTYTLYPFADAIKQREWVTNIPADVTNSGYPLYQLPVHGYQLKPNLSSPQR